MGLKLLRILAVAGVVGMMGGQALAAPPPVPANADLLLWCSSVYEGWSRALLQQRLKTRSRELATTARRLEDRGIAALDNAYAGADLEALLARYAADYAASLGTSEPPRFDPARCQALAAGSGA